MNKYTDFEVKTVNPELLDNTIQQLGSAFLEKKANDYPKTSGGNYTMRIMGDPEFTKDAIKKEGLGKIVKEIEHK